MNVIGDSTISLIDLIELLFDWINVTMFAEYNVNAYKVVKNNMKTTNLMDTKFEVKLEPKNIKWLELYTLWQMLYLLRGLHTTILLVKNYWLIPTV